MLRRNIHPTVVRRHFPTSERANERASERANERVTYLPSIRRFKRAHSIALPMLRTSSGIDKILSGCANLCQFDFAFANIRFRPGDEIENINHSHSDSTFLCLKDI